MGHGSRHSDFPQILGAFISTLFKALAYLAALLLKMCSWLLHKLSEIILKLGSNGH